MPHLLSQENDHLTNQWRKGKPANPGLAGKIIVKTVSVCAIHITARIITHNSNKRPLDAQGCLQMAHSEIRAHNLKVNKA